MYVCLQLLLYYITQYFAGGAGAEADIAKYLEKITSIIRLGYNFTSPSVRTRIDRYMMRNTDISMCTICLCIVCTNIVHCVLFYWSYL